MTFTGTLIEDLTATVERAEQRAQFDGASILGATVSESSVEVAFAEPIFAETAAVEPWFASVREIADYDPKILGVA
jgi:hypothetical protein